MFFESEKVVVFVGQLPLKRLQLQTTVGLRRGLTNTKGGFASDKSGKLDLNKNGQFKDWVYPGNIGKLSFQWGKRCCIKGGSFGVAPFSDKPFQQSKTAVGNLRCLLGISTKPLTQKGINGVALVAMIAGGLRLGLSPAGIPHNTTHKWAQARPKTLESMCLACDLERNTRITRRGQI